MNTPLLDTIQIPEDLRQLSPQQLTQLSQELRDFLLESVAQTGGHFASNLGTIELTIALHYVYQTPHDHLVWDVGHQSYPHKILTGRKNLMHTIRQYGGLAGFPKRSESQYDDFGVGHSSTSIGAALGMAVADKLAGSSARSVAIIGDGAMTAGQAFEALNCAGDMDINLLVILNDNEMSISPNVGALPKYLARNVMRDMRGVLHNIKSQSAKVLDKLPIVKEIAERAEHTIKTIASESIHVQHSLSLFENFGFEYTGAVDGHNLTQLVDILTTLRNKKGPQLLHVITRKGHGYKLAENDPVKYHAIGKAPTLASHDASGPTYTEVFSQWLIQQAQEDNRLVVITPAMIEGSGLVEFKQQFPDRCFDVGIAEQHAITFAAGLATRNIKPIVAIYSTFLQRAYDQLIHDVALQNLPVLFAIDRAGIVGADGPTHAGVYDLSFLRCIPNMVVATPADEQETTRLLSACYALNQPAAVRYPRGNAIELPPISPAQETIQIGKGIIRCAGEKIAFIAFGSMVQTAITVAQSFHATVADMRFVKPIDIDLLQQLAQTHDYLVCVEENATQGGASSAVLEALAQCNQFNRPVLLCGIPDVVTEHGDSAILLDRLQLSPQALKQRVQTWLAQFSH